MSFVVREYEQKDFEQVSRISQSVYAQKAGSFSIISNMTDNRMLKRYVVVNRDEQAVGYGLIWEQYTSPKRILKVEIVLHPEHQGMDIADKLFETLNQDILKLTPHAVQARTFNDQTYLLQCYGKNGFVENHRMMNVYLRTEGADLRPHLGIEDRLRSQGVILKTLADETA